MKWKIFSRPVDRERELTMLSHCSRLQSHLNAEMATYQRWPQKASGMSMWWAHGQTLASPGFPPLLHILRWSPERMWLKEMPQVTQLSALWGQGWPGFCLEVRTPLGGHWCLRLNLSHTVAVAVICRSAAAVHSLDKLTPICKPIYPALGQALWRTK